MACFVLNCTSSWKDDNLKFHHFPSDPERRKEWIKACKRTDLIDESPNFFKSKFVCSLHFEKAMYSDSMKHLLRSAVPSLQLTTTADSCTQTLEPIKFFRPSPYILEGSDIRLKKIEIRTSHTQTEKCMRQFNKNIEIKKENDITHTHIEKYNMQCEELKITDETRIKEEVKEDKLEVKEHVIKIEQNETAMMTDESLLISSDSEQESEDETSEMSIDEFLKLNKGLENQIREDLKKKNIPQIPIQEATCSKDVSETKGEGTDSEPESEGETYQRQENDTESNQELQVGISQTSFEEFLLDLNKGIEKQIGKVLKRKNTVQIENAKNSKKIRLHKETQTNAVTMFQIPKNNLCFEQCLRCGKNASRLDERFRYRKSNYTIKDFQDACEKYLCPTFSNTVKKQILLEYLLKENSQIQAQSQINF